MCAAGGDTSAEKKLRTFECSFDLEAAALPSFRGPWGTGGMWKLKNCFVIATFLNFSNLYLPRKRVQPLKFAMRNCFRDFFIMFLIGSRG